MLVTKQLFIPNLTHRSKDTNRSKPNLIILLKTTLKHLLQSSPHIILIKVQKVILPKFQQILIQVNYLFLNLIANIHDPLEQKPKPNQVKQLVQNGLLIFLNKLKQLKTQLCNQLTNQNSDLSYLTLCQLNKSLINQQDQTKESFLTFHVPIFLLAKLIAKSVQKLSQSVKVLKNQVVNFDVFGVKFLTKFISFFL